MLKHSNVPLLFLFIGSLLGVFLRWQFIAPTPGINYAFFLHGHSHIMFLGWVFNALFMGFVVNHIIEEEHRFFRRLFYVLQVFVAGMLISFPLQGYGAFSITFSTLHTIGAIVFAVAFINKVRSVTTISVWYARVALIFLVISTVGPFSLGYLMANGMGQSNWYHFSIYFYLHFQYNGFFLFGVFSLLFSLMERRKIRINRPQAKAIGVILTAMCIPTYLLSTLWAEPGYVFNAIGGGAALVQIAALVVLIVFIVQHRRALGTIFSKSSNTFLAISMVAFAGKLILQFLSAFPSLARMAYEVRPVVIAYLHLVLLGVISLSLLVWYVESRLVNRVMAGKWIIVFVISFVAMEGCLILTPWWSQVFGSAFYTSAVCTFVFSAILSISCLFLYMSSVSKTDKNQILG